MGRTGFTLSTEETQQLKRLVRRHANWRMREQTLLLLAQGKTHLVIHKSYDRGFELSGA